MKAYKDKNTTLFRFGIFEPYHEVRHFITSRLGGRSENQYAGFNLGYGTNDNAETVSANRLLLADSSGIPPDWFVYPRQTHSINIEHVTLQQRGLGVFSRNDAIPDTDALITSEKNICLTIQVADCVPVLLLDSKHMAIAAIHAGWRGTAGEIVKHTIVKMHALFGTRPEDIVAGIGPAIGPCCYEVGAEVKEKFSTIANADTHFHTKNNSLYLNLWEANHAQMTVLGVPPENIETACLCTRCNAATFYSSRQSNGDTGRFAAAMMLQ